MTFYDVFILFLLFYLLYNVRENNLRIRKLKKDLQLLHQKLLPSKASQTDSHQS